MTAQLSIVIPTYNERNNIPVLIEKLNECLLGISWEAIIVDDNSPDGTSDVAKKLAEVDSRIRCIRRINRKGLAGACIEGILSASSPIVAVMDGDLQHDETILPKMLDKIQNSQVDLVIGSRHIQNGSAESGFTKQRAVMSVFASSVARKLLCIKVSDLMSGFFMIRRDIIEQIAPDLSTSGFKILLDILVTSQSNLEIMEIGYNFRKRESGQSKLDAMVVFDYVGLLMNKITNGLLPIRFALFAVIGSFGVLVHMVFLYVLMSMCDIGFSLSQFVATMIAMTSNYFANNFITYRDKTIPYGETMSGLFRFYLVCMIGAIANISISSIIYEHYPNWIFASLCGVAMGSIWNYALSSSFVWTSSSRIKKSNKKRYMSNRTVTQS